VSDQPMISSGVKSRKSDKLVTENFLSNHIHIGMKALDIIVRDGRSVRHLKFN